MAKPQNSGSVKMDRKKRKSRIVDIANQRIKGIETFSPDLDFGNNKSLQNYKNLTQKVETAIKIYNQKMAEKNQAKQDLDLIQKELVGLNKKILNLKNSVVLVIQNGKIEKNKIENIILRICIRGNYYIAKNKNITTEYCTRCGNEMECKCYKCGLEYSDPFALFCRRYGNKIKEIIK